jgi:hypothetical protein
MTRRAAGLRALLERVRWAVVLPVLAYLLLVLTGTTTSSIGTAPLRQDPAAPLGHQLGASLSIRSDEFLTASTYALGVTATGVADDLNPLTASYTFVSLLGDGPFASVVLFDGALLRAGTVLPDAMVFAARWWLPLLLLVLSAPVFFRRVTGRAWLGWAVAGLMVASPSDVWWSFSPLTILGFTMAGSTALMTSADRWFAARRGAAVAWGLVAAVLLARTPLHYQPWAIVVAVPILLIAVVAAVLDAPSWKRGAAVVGVVGALSVALLAGFLWEARASLEAAVQTLYPGHRVSTGTAVAPGLLFGAAGLGLLENIPIFGSNDSEISSSFTVAAVLAAVLATRRLTFFGRTHRVATVVAGAFTLFWFSWVTIDYGSLGTHLPVIALVPANRAAGVLGFLALITLGLVLAAMPDRSGWKFGAAAAVVTALASGYGVSSLLVLLPDLPTSTIWVSSAVVGAVSYLLATRPRHVLGYAIALVGAVSLVFRVNPILVGLGDLRDSTVATTMLQAGPQLRADDKVWASDSMYVDAVMAATGVPSLSGRQLAGPDAPRWQALAPGSDESSWNRGGSFIVFSWNDSTTVTVSTPQPDVIVVSASPCTVADRVPELTSIISSSPLDDSCLAPAGTFIWGGQREYQYDIEG